MVNIFQCANCDSVLCVSHLNLERDISFNTIRAREVRSNKTNYFRLRQSDCSLSALSTLLVLSECPLNALWVLLWWIWAKKMKIESLRQTRLGRTDKVTPCAPVGAKKLPENCHSTLSHWRKFYEFMRDDKYSKVKLKFIFLMGPFIMMHKKFGMLWSTSVSHNKFKCKTSQKRFITLRSNENLLFIVL